MSLSIPTPPRLLSLLSLIEAALPDRERLGEVQRTADYGKGVARMRFSANDGSIVLQNFLLADGQLCVRIDLARAGESRVETIAVYPHSPDFDWSAAAAKIAFSWCLPTPTMTPVPAAEMNETNDSAPAEPEVENWGFLSGQPGIFAPDPE